MLDKIYLLNHKDFENRRITIENKLKNQGIEYELVQHFHPNDFDYEKMMEGWEYHEDIDVIQPHGVYKNFSKKISVGSLSLVLKHLWCYNNQLENNYKNVLILEDDCDIPSNFKKYLDNNVKEFLELNKNQNIEMVMLGTSHDFISKGLQPGKFVHYYENQKTRCTHAYIVNINATKRIVDRFKPFNLPIDFKLNEIIQIENIKVDWSEPGLKQK